MICAIVCHPVSVILPTPEGAESEHGRERMHGSVGPIAAPPSGPDGRRVRERAWRGAPPTLLYSISAHRGRSEESAVR